MRAHIDTMKVQVRDEITNSPISVQEIELLNIDTAATLIPTIVNRQKDLRIRFLKDYDISLSSTKAMKSYLGRIIGSATETKAKLDKSIPISNKLALPITRNDLLAHLLKVGPTHATLIQSEVEEITNGYRRLIDITAEKFRRELTIFTTRMKTYGEKLSDQEQRIAALSSYIHHQTNSQITQFFPNRFLHFFVPGLHKCQCTQWDTLWGQKIREEIKAEIRGDLKAEIREEIKADTREDLKAEIKEEIENELREQIQSETWDEAVEEALYGVWVEFNTRAQEHKETESLLKDQLMNQRTKIINEYQRSKFFRPKAFINDSPYESEAFHHQLQLAHPCYQSNPQALDTLIPLTRETHEQNYKDIYTTIATEVANHSNSVSESTQRELEKIRLEAVDALTTVPASTTQAEHPYLVHFREVEQ